MRRWTREEPDNEFCRSCTPLDPWFKTSISQKSAPDAAGASGIAISTQRRPAPIELIFGGRVLHMIGNHAVKSAFAHLQYLADEIPRACCSVLTSGRGISQGHCEPTRPTQEVAGEALDSRGARQ